MIVIANIYCIAIISKKKKLKYCTAIKFYKFQTIPPVETTVKERLKKYIKYKNLTAKEFCISINVSPGFISGMRESIQPDKLYSIAIKYPDLNIGWLMTSVGSMINVESISKGINANYQGTFSEPVGVIVGGGRIGNDSNPCKSDPVGEEFAKVVNENIKLQMENEHLKMSLKLKEDILREKDAIIGMKNERIEMLIEEKRSKE